MHSWGYTHNIPGKIPKNINSREKGLARVDIFGNFYRSTSDISTVGTTHDTITPKVAPKGK